MLRLTIAHFNARFISLKNAIKTSFVEHILEAI